jgi:hypothetical protein
VVGFFDFKASIYEYGAVSFPFMDASHALDVTCPLFEA